MPEGKSPDLTTGAQRLIAAALEKRKPDVHNYLGVNHWLLALLERHGPMVESLLGGADIEGMISNVSAKLSRGELGPALDISVAETQAGEMARQRGKMQAAERDLASVILQTAGYTLPAPEESQASQSAQTETSKETREKAAPASLLQQFGLDLTQAARDGKLRPLVGREEEVQLMLETLCRNTKRNPVLIGPAGVGKTAIVEGLADRVAAGKVPDLLKGERIISLQPSVLVAGADYRGELEKRMKGILKEAIDQQIILFIDEIHTIVGAGGTAGTNDISALLKPALARGEIAVIAATTDDEYRRFIEADTALERRFQPIRVNELNPDQTYEVISALSEALSKKYHVQIDPAVLHWLIQFGQQFMKNRHFPDKAVDLLEQSVAHTVAQNIATLTLAEAQEVAQRMVGMPLSLDTRLTSLQGVLQSQGLMRPVEIQDLVNRLQVTMRGLDLRATRPNAVVLLSGAAAESSETLSRTIAGALFGDPERVVTIDLSRMLHPEDVALLVGAPPGYVGYSDTLPLHRLAQIPWCVVRFENVDLCHPSVRAVVAQGILEGRLTDGRGKPIYFSDTVVLMTAQVQLEVQHSMGFQLDGQQQGISGGEIYRSIAEAIGEEMASQVDVFMPGVQPVEISKQWLKDSMLADLADRFLKQGLRLEWDASLVDWLAQTRNQFLSEREWERWIDFSLSPAIVNYLPKPGNPAEVVVMVKIEADAVKVEPLEQT